MNGRIHIEVHACKRGHRHALRCLAAAVCAMGTALAAGMAAATASYATAAAASRPETDPTAAVATPAAASAPARAAKVLGSNVYIVGASVQPGASVDGDFLALGGRIVVDQPVGGDITAAAGAVDIRAPVGDDLRAEGGDVRVAATVAGEAFASGGHVVLTPDARIGRGAGLYGGSVRIEGRIDGPLTARAQHLSLQGVVAGDADLRAQTIELGPGARIDGALRYASPNEIVRAEGAAVAGPITRAAFEERGREQHPEGPHMGAVGWTNGEMQRNGHWSGMLLAFAAVLASGLLALLLFPRFAANAAQALRASPGRALFFGAAALLAVPVLAVLLFITLLGIPLGIVLLALYPPLLLAGYVLGVYFIARRAQVALSPAESTPSTARTMGFFALALLLLTLLGGLPAVGGLVMAAVTVLGVGAGVLALKNGGASPPAAATPS